MAADHGITMEGVSAYPSEVTAQMVQIFLHGGAAINVLARQENAAIKIVDIGVAGTFNHEFEMERRKIASGTQNMAAGTAMSVKEMEKPFRLVWILSKRKSIRAWT